METVREKTNAPWHVWAVGLLALLFTSYGAYDYYMSQTGNRDYIAAAVEPMGMDVDMAVAYFSTFPWWADAVWAIGVWSGVIGSALILLRQKLAYPVLVLSLAGMVASNAYSLGNPAPGMTDNSVTYMVTAVIFAIMLAITLYARAMAARGVLR